VNVDLQRMLTERADSVEVPVLDPRDVLAHGKRLAQSRHRLASGGVAAALALTLGTAALLVDRDGTPPPPTDQPVPVPEWTPGTRPLTYGQGQTLHLGERKIDTGLDFLSIDPTDDGAALTTSDGGIWFADGTTVERIGTTLGERRIDKDSSSFLAGDPHEWVASADAGSTLAWMEFPSQRVDRPELVVYDSGTRNVLARRPVEVSDRNSATVLDLVDDAVFVAEADHGSFDPTPIFRYDLDTGTLDLVVEADVEAARRDVTRALVVGSATYGELLHTPDRTNDTRSVQTLAVDDSKLDGLRDPHTGNAVEIMVPERYDGDTLWFTQWLDDDRFALFTGVGIGDLLVCRISAGRCEVVVEGFSGKAAALTPGDGLLGADRALVRDLSREQPRSTG
jgi:hypothetical protein